MKLVSIKKIADRLLCKSPKLYRALLKISPNQGRREKNIYLQFVKDGDYAIDIGANVGNITLLLSNIVGRKGKVFSYEALEPTYQKLVTNIAENGFYKNITALNYAAGDAAQEISITVPDNDFGQASMRTHEKGSWNAASAFTTFKANAILLDSHISAFEKVDFIKIDIEGAELLALKGAVETIKKFRPVLYLEVYKGWTKEFGYQPIDIYNFIKALGYIKFCVVTGQGIENITNAEHQLNLDYSADLLCIYS